MSLSNSAPNFDLNWGPVSIRYKANYFSAPVEVCGCGCGKKIKKHTCAVWKCAGWKAIVCRVCGCAKIGCTQTLCNFGFEGKGGSVPKTIPIRWTGTC